MAQIDAVTAGGVALPPIGLGTMRQQGPACVELVEAALAEGYRHLDTARKYGNEAEVGEGLRRSSVPRDEVLVTTRLTPDELAAPDVRPAAEESLRTLGLDHVDLLLIHWPSPSVPIEETLGEFAALRDAGLTRAIGVANLPSTPLREAAAAFDLATDQVEYHPYLAQPAVLGACRDLGLALTAYCPLARAGDLLRDEVLVSLARTHDRTPAQIALRWLVQQANVVAIPGASSVTHLRENLDVHAFHLADDEVARIDHLARGERVVDPPHAPVWD